LGKYPWEVVTWEKSFGKVPNIISSDPPCKDCNARFTTVKSGGGGAELPL